MKKSFIFSVIACFFVVTLFQACDEEDDLTIDDVLLVRDTVKLTYPDTVNNRTINYSVTVVSAGNASGKVEGTEGATVAVAIDGVVSTMTTDANGIAAFTGLKAGDAGVVVSADNHSTANLTVDLHLNRDPEEYDAEGQRYAATTVVLFPTSGAGTATLKGRTTHLYDDFNGLSRGAPADTKIIATIAASESEMWQFIDHSGDGEILDVVYEGITATGSVDASGNYEITVPAAGNEGLELTITPDDFLSEYIGIDNSTSPPTAASPTQVIWRPSLGSTGSTTMTFVSGSTQYLDIAWTR